LNILLKPAVKSWFAEKIFGHAVPSYSQSGEDMIVRFALNAMGVSMPTYIDIGAYHPQHLSNTAYFYDIGCSGINIEPNPKLFKVFEQYRQHDINLNIGISDIVDELDFFVMSVDTLSTFSQNEANKFVLNHGLKIVETIKVKVYPVSEVLAEYAGKKYPEFLSLDAEGIEERVLHSINFNDWKPLVICCETISYSTTGIAEKNFKVIDYLQSIGYMIYADTYINTIFVLKSAWEKGA